MKTELTQPQIDLILSTISARLADPESVTLQFLVALLELHNSPRAWTTLQDRVEQYWAGMHRYHELRRLFGPEVAEAALEAGLADVDNGE